MAALLVAATVFADVKPADIFADGVTDPKQVRYGWKKWFEPTLFNAEGLPASPFRTDDFEPETKDRYYLGNLK